MTYLIEIVDGLFVTFMEHLSLIFGIIINNPALVIVTFGLTIIGAVFGYTQRLIKGR